MIGSDNMIWSNARYYSDTTWASWCHKSSAIRPFFHEVIPANHYIDVIMTTMASQFTSLTVVYTTVYSDADQTKHQSSASLAFVWGIHRDRWIPRTKGQLRGKCFHLMTSSWSKKKWKRHIAVPMGDDTQLTNGFFHWGIMHMRIEMCLSRNHRTFWLAWFTGSPWTSVDSHIHYQPSNVFQLL